jgi:hypothetical protein
MVRLAGIEPTTPWFVAKYSIQLSYSRQALNYSAVIATDLPSKKKKAIFGRRLAFQALFINSNPRFYGFYKNGMSITWAYA